MTIKMIHTLSDIKDLIDYWNGNGFITEEEMYAQLKKFCGLLREALDEEPLPGFGSR